MVQTLLCEKITRHKTFTYMNVNPFSFFSEGIRVWEEHRMEHNRRDTWQDGSHIHYLHEQNYEIHKIIAYV